MMRIIIVFLLFSSVSVFMTSCDRGKEISKKPAIERIVEQVSEGNMQKTISDLVDFGTRFPYEKQLEVADYLFGRMKQYLDSTSFHKYEYWGVEWKNVVGAFRFC